MKSLKQVLKEFDYGNKLFADPDTIASATQEEEKYKQWLASKGIEPNEYETDTDEEYEALYQIASYIEDGSPHNAKDAAAFISKHGKLLKGNFPEIMDPEYGGRLVTLYRGASMAIDAIVQAIGKDAEYQKRIIPGGDLYEYIMMNPSTWYDYIPEFRSKTSTDNVATRFGGDYWIAINYSGEVTSRNQNGFLSTTTATRIAKSFGAGSIIKKMEAKRWPAIVSVPFPEVRSRAFINPQWAASIAEFEEDEVWVLGDSLPVDKLWVRCPSRTNVSENSVTVGPLIRALYWQHIDPKAFAANLRSELTSEKGFDEKSYERLASESPILNPRF